MAAQATNNALAHIEQGERRLLERLASAVIVRLQDSVKKNPIEGYVRALGRNTMEFFKLSPSVSKHEFGVKIEDRPTEEVKARLMGILQNSVAQGQVDFEDAVYIEQITNLKQAQQVLSYRIKKKKEEAQANAQKQQEMGKSNSNLLKQQNSQNNRLCKWKWKARCKWKS